MKRLAAIPIVLLVVFVVALAAQSPAPVEPPSPCTVQAECTMANYYASHTPAGTNIATRCSPIYCDTLLDGPEVKVCVQTRYGLPGEVGFRPLSVCLRALADGA